MRRGGAFFRIEESRHLVEKQPTSTIRNVHHSEKWPGAAHVKRSDILARDGLRCVYCGGVFESDELSVDHVQPKMRGGDGSAGNVVTACRGCNTAKGGRRLSRFLAETPHARRNFFQFARYVWPRHLIAVAEELARQGVVEHPADFVEGVRKLRSSEAIAIYMKANDPEAD
ncbi:MAG: HNH endonuclease [Gemmatimonas sp.]